jgi:hypothetical protein
MVIFKEKRMDKAPVKRLADFLEKLAVAGIALGIFQDKP